MMLWWRFRKYLQTTFKAFSLKWQERSQEELDSLSKTKDLII